MTKTITKTLSTAWAAAALGVLSLQSPAAHAQTSASDAAVPEGLTEIVVTARRRTENLQDVPVAVTAIGAATIQTQDVTNLDDLNSFVPNFKIAADRATSSTINVYIRGVGQRDRKSTRLNSSHGS